MSRQLRFGSGSFLAGAAAATACLALGAPARADSIIIQPEAGYRATDRLPDSDLTALDVQGDMVTSYVDGHVKVFDRTTWQVLYDLGDAGYAPSSTTFVSFTTFSPGGNSLWVGYTVIGNNDDRIYEVTDFRTSPVWNQRATLPSNFDLAFHGTTTYVSGPNSSQFGADNSIWRLDGGSATLVAGLSGYASGMAFDAAGNLYYVTNLGADNRLVRFSAQQVAEGNKTLANAEVLTSMPFPGADVAVDAAGHVLFTFNESDAYWAPVSCTLAMWDGASGVGNHYQVIGGNGEGHSYPNVNVVGDVTADGTIYLNDAGSYWVPVLGLAEITAVPEPSTLVLVGVGAGAATVWRWRRRRG
jgi:hypothetical protein